ncbi:hypothetical protein [Polyangium jinanense]|uniref:Uncharacterized protein n=1 Tax=Polyangium jinanense TaxID=2829994 RepID=A0A9X4AUC0_9BACT|nr:hypothetical protein [Polyangium jinanense]MDC3958600.1 hypothetical protein [Polyangium jinanense]MDC3983092.1 hypothetical protein [Polyangium jinanense]
MITRLLQRLREHAPWVGLVLGLLLGVVFGATYFPSAGHDDSHITFWVSHALARFGAIVNYNGAPIEQSSSFSLVVWLALAEKLTGAGAPILGWITSIGCAALALGVVTVLARGVSPRLSPLAAPLLATSLCFLYWSTSGMETSMTALFGVLAVLVLARYVESEPSETAGRGQTVRALAPVVLVSAGFAGARPESPVVLLALAATAATYSFLLRTLDKTAEARRRFLRSLHVLGAAITPVVVLAVSRKVAFGSAVPNPASMKSGGFDFDNGLRYAQAGFQETNSAYVPLLCVALGMVAWGVVKRRLPMSVVLTAALAFASTAFVLMSGGDWMTGARFLVPAMPAYVVLMLFAIDRASQERAAAVGFLFGATLLWLNVNAVIDFGRSPLNMSHRWAEARKQARAAREKPGMAAFSFPEIANRPHRRDAKLLPAFLETLEKLGPTREQPLSFISGQAGMVPFHVVQKYYGALHFLDQYNLSSKELANCVPARAQQRLVHGVHIELKYIIEHAKELEQRCNLTPPVIIFDAGRPPVWLSKYGYQVIYDDHEDLPAYIAVHTSVAERLRK